MTTRARVRGETVKENAQYIFGDRKSDFQPQMLSYKRQDKKSNFTV
jgi:hypothetical protein